MRRRRRAPSVVRSAARGQLYGEADVPATPVALVLGAQVYPDGTPSPFLAARLDVAVRLYAADKVESVLVSGDSLAPEYDEPLAMRRYLLAAGLPPDRVSMDRHGFDTYESCLRARDVFGLSRVTFVSQAYHLPRAVGTACLLGLDAVGVGDRSVQWLPSGRPSRTWWLGAVRDAAACVKTVRDLRAATVRSRSCAVGGGTDRAGVTSSQLVIGRRCVPVRCNVVSTHRKECTMKWHSESEEESERGGRRGGGRAADDGSVDPAAGRTSTFPRPTTHRPGSRAGCPTTGSATSP